jgi:isocitrate dehydrogenase (NAD+)
LAFQLAVQLGRSKVHCIHKANILKMADGLYLDCFRRVAAEFPQIKPLEMIVDNACMQMVSRPTQFEVVAAGNLYGDLLGDLGAGLVGGVGTAAAINSGDQIKVYEAVAGATHERVPPGQGNPLPVLLALVELLRDQGQNASADRIEAAFHQAVANPATRTADLGGTATTEQFTQAVEQALATPTNTG